MFQDGGGRRNHVNTKNQTEETIELHSHYIHWGRCSVPPSPVIAKQDGDTMLFINAGSWAATGSSGLVQWKLCNPNENNNKYLLFMWDAPFCFNFSDNFLGMWIYDAGTDNAKLLDITDVSEI